MIDLIAIDGPVGVGKSSVAHRLAERFGWQHLDTGAMYRAVGVLALKGGVSLEDEAACAALAQAMQFEFVPDAAGQRVRVNGKDATESIRTPEATEAVSTVADHVGVREELGRRQKELGAAAPSVAEGRDMGTVVFPLARWKFYIEADPAERARRRAAQLAEQGNPEDEAELKKSIEERDRRDRERPVGALRIAADAVVIDTTRLTLDQVVELIERIVRDEMAPE